jgi:hypothetical protein
MQVIRKSLWLIVISLILMTACNAPADPPPADFTTEPTEAPTEVPPAEANNVFTLYVGPRLVECMGMAPQMCMLVKESPEAEYSLFYDGIQGFTYAEGNEYQLAVRRETIQDPPADGSSELVILDSVISQTPVDISGPAVDLLSPENGTTISLAAPVTVTGLGWALFEGNVGIEVVDAAGNVLLQTSAIVDSPNAGTGGSGPWSANLTFSAPAGSQVTIRAFVASAMDGSIVAEDSIVVTVQ